MTDSRERFEAWCESESINASRLASGIYTYPSARVAWRGWQAAERQALERAAQLCEHFEREKWMRMATGGGLDVKTAGDCALAIRAPIPASTVASKEEKS